MAKIRLIKIPGGYLRPSTKQDQELLEKYKNGSILIVDIKQQRNAKLHRKFMLMLHVAFDAFEPEVDEYNGLPVVKNFERFRKDVIIAAGHYDLVTNIKGEVRAEAKSIAFNEMSEEDFNVLYNQVLNILLHKVLRNYNRDDIDRVVKELEGFA